MTPVRGRKPRECSSEVPHFLRPTAVPAPKPRPGRRDTIDSVRKLLTWIVVTIGIAALIRKLRSRGHKDEAEPVPAGADPADELRQKLASSRDAEPVPEPVTELVSEPVTEPAPAAAMAGGAVPATKSVEDDAEFKPVEPPTPEPASDAAIDERRADVHDEGRAAIDEMRKSAED